MEKFNVKDHMVDKHKIEKTNSKNDADNLMLEKLKIEHFESLKIDKFTIKKNQN